jgi:hypothetical protein
MLVRNLWCRDFTNLQYLRGETSRCQNTSKHHQVDPAAYVLLSLQSHIGLARSIVTRPQYSTRRHKDAQWQLSDVYTRERFDWAYENLDSDVTSQKMLELIFNPSSFQSFVRVLTLTRLYTSHLAIHSHTDFVVH